ncbi:hypothetical protein KL943_005261 [Ogataea angusta]|nr:hypothetical protein KL943_005261 [Ogataea angusta]
MQWGAALTGCKDKKRPAGEENLHVDLAEVDQQLCEAAGEQMEFFLEVFVEREVADQEQHAEVHFGGNKVRRGTHVQLRDVLDRFLFHLRKRGPYTQIPFHKNRLLDGICFPGMVQHGHLMDGVE